MTQNTTARPLPPSPGNLFSASLRPSRLIPGLPLSLGYTLFYLSALVLIPLGGMVFKTAQLSASEFWQTITDPIVVASFKLTFGASALAAIINGVFGLIVAWVLVREPFPGRRIFDALIDFPFALPTAVAGLTFSQLCLPDGWIGGLGRHITGLINSIAAFAERGPLFAKNALSSLISLFQYQCGNCDCLNLCWASLHRADRAAGTTGLGHGTRTSGYGPWGRSMDYFLARRFPRNFSGAQRPGVGLCPRLRRIWLGYFNCRKHSRQVADCAASDRYQARRFSVCVSNRDRCGLARFVAAYPACDQWTRVVGEAS
jgi:hypothetical protein